MYSFCRTVPFTGEEFRYPMKVLELAKNTKSFGLLGTLSSVSYESILYTSLQGNSSTVSFGIGHRS